MSKGIDYGLGRTNIDKETGIRYGVIPANAVDFWYDHAEPDYGEPRCPMCGEDVRDTTDFSDEDLEGFERGDGRGDYACVGCRIVFDSDQVSPDSPLAYILDEDGYEATCGEDGDVFMLRAPYFTRAAFCSPCAPGACYLLNPCEDGERAFCFGHDWFEDGKAPYPVYSVETGERVWPAS